MTPVLHFPDALPAKRPCFDGKYDAPVVRVEIRGWAHRKVPIYDVKLNSDFPFCFHASDGRTYKPHKSRYESDGGSVPFLVQGIRVPCINLMRDVFLPQYFLHDSGCDEHGFDYWTGTDWEFVKLTRAQVDWLLNDSLSAVPTERFPQTANAVERSLIYGAVRAYGRLFCPW